jgi:biopolymer transport protein ExbD
MATISTGQHAGKKALDSAIPLVPFIDLLLCCVMFLLVTAVWNDLAGIQATQRVPGAASIDAPVAEEPAVTLSIRRTGFEISTEAGDRTWVDGDDFEELGRTLGNVRRMHATGDLDVGADDGIPYAALIRVLDRARELGFRRIDVRSSTP